MINREMFRDMVEMQRELDAIIMKNQGIEKLIPERIHASYIVEVAETVNEMKGDFKYWSVKAPEKQKFLEELVDATHFMLSYSYVKADAEYETYHYEEGEDRIDYRYRLLKDEMLRTIDHYGLRGLERWELAGKALLVDLLISYSYLLIIASEYDITAEMLMSAYRDKYRINIERSQSGTY